MSALDSYVGRRCHDEHINREQSSRSDVLSAIKRNGE